MDKKWYESKTMWINIMAIAGAILTGVAGEWQASGTLTVMAVANIVLRKLTDSGIRF